MFRIIRSARSTYDVLKKIPSREEKEGSVDVTFESFNEIKELILSDTPIYCSDAQQCQKISEYLNQPAKIKKNLREIDFGNLSGKNICDIQNMPEWKSWKFKPQEFTKFTNGESFEEFENRILQCIAKIVAKNIKGEVQIILEDGAYRMLECFFHDESRKNFWSHNTSSFELNHECIKRLLERFPNVKKQESPRSPSSQSSSEFEFKKLPDKKKKTNAGILVGIGIFAATVAIGKSGIGQLLVAKLKR